jgi:Ca2+-binding EF-hand superfamily protein
LDHDHNGWLDKEEAFNFVKILSDCIDDLSRVQNFSWYSFAAIFDKFDEDNNGFLEKAEMAVLIKQVFRRPEWLTRGEEKMKVVK